LELSLARVRQKRVPGSQMPSLSDRALRMALTAVHQCLKLLWFVRRPRTFGAHALARTPEGRIILVKLRYAPGWRLPGGGRAEDEDPREAVLRELREEIGMTAHGDVRLACELDESADFKRDVAALFVVDGVRYAPPRWSWEIEQVREAALDDLPPDMSPRAARWIEAIRDHL
jgi:8-oxo-dGTP pyrophosphatase MutT (NUDIX family)